MKLYIFIPLLVIFVNAFEEHQSEPGAFFVEGKEANDLAAKILDQIWANRHESYINSLDTPERRDRINSELSKLIEVQTNVVKKIQKKYDNIKRKETIQDSLEGEKSRLDTLNKLKGGYFENIKQEINKKLKNDPNNKNILTSLQGENNRLEFLKKLKDGYFENIKQLLQKEKNYNTVSLMFIDNKMYVSANIKTISLPLPPDHPKMIQILSSSSKSKSIDWFPQDVELKPFDGRAVFQVLDGEASFPRQVDDVLFAHPIDDSKVESMFNSELVKLKEEYDTQVEELEERRKLDVEETSKPSKNPTKLSYDEDLERIKSEYDKKRATLYNVKSREFHAEVVHVTFIKDKLKGGPVLIGTSKPLCDKCKKFVTEVLNEKLKYYQAKDGLSLEKVLNWKIPESVQVEKISRGLYKDAPHDTPTTSGGASESIQGACLRSGRARRAATPGCVFFTSEGSPSKKPKVQEIDSSAFIEMYKKSPPDVKLVLSKVAASASDANVVGKPQDIDSLSKIVHHEKMKTHENNLKNVAGALSGGSLDVDSLENVRVSPKKMRYQTSEGLKKISNNAGKVSGALGRFLLAKGVVQGIVSGDTTGLAIMGGTVGGELALELAGKYGSKVVLKAGTKLGIKAAANYASKALKGLGKMAGPIGTVVDIGLSAWQLSSAIKTLKNPDATKWEQNEAIADIVSQSVDIAITLVTTVASIAFPPLAPVFALIGILASIFTSAAVAVYKAYNHVDMLNSKIPLLAHEKVDEFSRNFIGKETSEYITTLIETKFAHNLAVNASIQLMEENSDIIGHVIPTTTRTWEDRFSLIEKTCIFMGILSICQYNRTISTRCFHNGACLDYCERKCVDTTKIYSSGEDSIAYKCKLSRIWHRLSPVPVNNQIVNFSIKEQVYLDRAIPDIPYKDDYEVVCRPSSKTYKGFQVSQSSKSSAHLCVDAIATRKKSGSGKYMLFDLKDGDDTVWTDNNDTTENRFLVGNGRKYFVGGKGEDVFVLTKCGCLNGQLFGQLGNNTLAVGDDCDKKLEINMASGLVRGTGVSIQVHNISNVYGRAEKEEKIIASCLTQHISSGGGHRSGEDYITMSQVSGCERKVTVYAESYTSVEGGPKGVHSIVLVSENASCVTVSPIKSLGARGDVTAFIKHSANSLLMARVSKETLYLFFENNRRATVIGTLTSSSRHILNYLLNVSDCINHSGIRNVTIEMSSGVNIFLEESQDSSTQVVIDNDKTSARCLHTLSISGGNREGCPNYSNTFYMTGGHWDVTGGSVDDTFYLAEDFVTGKLNGGEGTDALHIAPAFGSDLLQVYINQGVMRSYNLSEVFRFENFEMFYGRSGKQDVVHCSWSTSFVSTGGGASKLCPDEIYTDPYFSNATILVTGFSRVFVPSGTGFSQIRVSPLDFSDTKLTVGVTPNKGLLVDLPFPSSSLQLKNSENTDLFQISGSFNLSSHILSIDLKFEDNTLPDEYVDNLYLHMEELSGAQSRLMVPSDIKVQSPLVFHRLEPSPNASIETRAGASDIPNYFQILSGHWNVVGGDKDDVFELQEIPSGALQGGPGTNDVRLTSTSEEVQQVTVDLDAGILYGETKWAKINEIQRIFGDANWKETIWIGCDTQFIVTGGNTNLTQDVVGFKNKTCENPVHLQIIAVGHTHVDAPGDRNLTFQVQPSENKSLNFTLKAQLTNNSTKVILLQLSPHELSGWTDIQKDDILSTHLFFGPEQHVELHLSEDVTEERETEEGFLQNIQMIFIQANSTNIQASLMVERKSRRPFILHEIEGVVESGVVQGAPVVSNYFTIRTEAEVKVIGGPQDDTFHVVTPFPVKLIGHGGINTIIPECPSPVVDFQTGVIECNKTVGTFEIIQVGKGVPGKTEKFVVGCSTKLVASGGGESSSNPDLIYIGQFSECERFGPETTIYVEGATRLRNEWTGPGSFVYVVSQESPFEIYLPLQTKSTQVVRFQFGIDKIKSVQYEQNKIYMYFRSGRNAEFPMMMSPPKNIQNPEIQFENGNDRLYISVDEGLVHATFSIRDATSLKFLRGISGGVNDFTVNLTTSSVLKDISGADLDDNFQLISIPGLRSMAPSISTVTQKTRFFGPPSPLCHNGVTTPLYHPPSPVTSRFTNIYDFKQLKLRQITCALLSYKLAMQ